MGVKDIIHSYSYLYFIQSRIRNAIFVAMILNQTIPAYNDISQPRTPLPFVMPVLIHTLPSYLGMNGLLNMRIHLHHPRIQIWEISD
jgi:hypothetical protein